MAKKKLSKKDTQMLRQMGIKPSLSERELFPRPVIMEDKTKYKRSREKQKILREDYER